MAVFLFYFFILLIQQIRIDIYLCKHFSFKKIKDDILAVNDRRNEIIKEQARHSCDTKEYNSG